MPARGGGAWGTATTGRVRASVRIRPNASLQSERPTRRRGPHGLDVPRVVRRELARTKCGSGAQERERAVRDGAWLVLRCVEAAIGTLREVVREAGGGTAGPQHQTARSPDQCRDPGEERSQEHRMGGRA